MTLDRRPDVGSADVESDLIFLRLATPDSNGLNVTKIYTSRDIMKRL